MTGRDIKGLFLAHRRELQAYLTGKLRDREVAADLTQETFLRFAEQAGDSTVLHKRSYLYRTAHNLAVDYIRQSQRQRTDPTAYEYIADIPEDRPSMEDDINARERLDLLRAAVLELSERTRQVFVLNRIKELTYGEVATRLGISESSVQKHLAKALQHVLQRDKQL